MMNPIETLARVWREEYDRWPVGASLSEIDRACMLAVLRTMLDIEFSPTMIAAWETASTSGECWAAMLTALIEEGE